MSSSDKCNAICTVGFGGRSRIGGRAVSHDTQSNPSVRLNVMSGDGSRYAALTNGVELPQTTTRAPPIDLSRVVATARSSGPGRSLGDFFGDSFEATNVATSCSAKL